MRVCARTRLTLSLGKTHGAHNLSHVSHHVSSQQRRRRRGGPGGAGESRASHCMGSMGTDEDEDVHLTHPARIGRPAFIFSLASSVSLFQHLYHHRAYKKQKNQNKCFFLFFLFFFPSHRQTSWTTRLMRVLIPASPMRNVADYMMSVVVCERCRPPCATAVSLVAPLFLLFATKQGPIVYSRTTSPAAFA